MDLIHYASKPLALESRQTMQDVGYKPNGLWVSDGTEWLDWCRSEEFRTGLAWYSHRVILGAALLLHLKTPGDLDTFTHRYGREISPKLQSLYIDWPAVALEYDGILISPYQWSRRLTIQTHWYYGWDVASGCLWNTASVGLGEAVEVNLAAVTS